MCYIDLEPCEVWHESEQKARKEHGCSCCHRTIVAGEVYVHHFSKFEGDVTSSKLCLECKADRQEFADAHGGMLCEPGSFPAMLSLCIGEDDESADKWRPMQDRLKSRASMK